MVRDNLPRIYAALTRLTGPGGNLFDPWKGAYAFPFKMTVRRGEQTHRYLLKLTNYRSMVSIDLYRVLQAGESYDKQVYHAPFDEELSTAEMAFVVGFLKGFLQGFLETMPSWTEPFLMEVQSNAILFGYDPDAQTFFQQQFQEPAEYEAALTSWRARIPLKVEAEQQDELEW